MRFCGREAGGIPLFAQENDDRHTVGPEVC